MCVILFVCSSAMSKAAHYTAHSMGANALCAALLSDGRLGVFSGGDDQALSCCALDLQVGIAV